MSIEQIPKLGLGERILGHFPERQIYFRARGVVRFIQIGTNVQLATVGAMSVAVVWIALTTIHFLTRDLVLEAREQTITEMAAEQAQLNQDMGELQRDVVTRAERLEQRQQYLDALMADDPSGTVGPALITPASGEPEGDTETKATDKDHGKDDRGVLATPTSVPQTASRFYSLFPSAQAARSNTAAADFRSATQKRLDGIETKQMRLATGLTNHARSQLLSLDEIISPTGLASGDLIAKWQGRSGSLADAADFAFGTGGPLIPDPLLGNNAENLLIEIEIDGRIKALDDAWSEMLKAYDVLDSLPLGEPATKYYLSSHYGRRLDPFKKTRAMHSGIDLAGWPGTEIDSGAGGIVVKAGTWGAYGKMVEIDHGNGFRTRYGHLRSVKVKRGQIIEPGQRIGEMGCSGRCTSTHLHYEVWFGDRPRNPLPFLKVADNVFKIQQRRDAAERAGEE